MAKSSIRFEKAGQHLAKHNFREDKPSYLLPKEFQKENSVWKSEISAREFFKQEQEKIQNRRGARKASFENSHWEAVLNLNSNHNLTDCQAVAKHIEKKFNIKCHSIAIHHDEGHLVHKSSGKHLSPGLDYYTDKTGKSFFINEQGEKTKEPLNISEFEPVYNYHAHLEFSTYKDQKQNWRKSLTQPKLRELQSEVAEILQMQRGKENSKTQHKGHQQHKREQHAIEQEKFKKREIEKELFNTKEALEALRKESKNQGYTAEYFRELNKAKKELTFQTQEQFNKWKNDLIQRHTKKGVLGFGEKIDTEAVLTEQFEKIEQLNAIIQATEQSKEQELQNEKEKLEQENKDLQIQLKAKANEYIFERESEITANAKEREQAAENTIQTYNALKENLNQSDVSEAIKKDYEAKLKKEREAKKNLEQENEQLKAENKKQADLIQNLQELTKKAETELKKLKETIERAVKMSWKCSFNFLNDLGQKITKQISFKEFADLDKDRQIEAMNGNIERVAEKQEKEKQEKEKNKNRGLNR